LISLLALTYPNFDFCIEYHLVYSSTF